MQRLAKTTFVATHLQMWVSALVVTTSFASYASADAPGRPSAPSPAGAPRAEAARPSGAPPPPQASPGAPAPLPSSSASAPAPAVAPADSPAPAGEPAAPLAPDASAPATKTPAPSAAPTAVPAAPASAPNPAGTAAGADVASSSTFALERSVVHVASDRPGSWLEARSTLEDHGWERVCAAPCNRAIVVQGALLRVTAPGMTPSNGFRIEHGPGTALVKVEGGSATSRSYGILALGVGIPISLTGMGLYGYGRYADQTGTRTAGAVTLGIGALAVLASLPLLVSGSTDVRDGKGSLIARLLGDGRLRL